MARRKRKIATKSKLKPSKITDAFKSAKKEKPRPKKIKKDETLSDDENTDEADMAILKQFDLNLEYGPCIGITRLERWERAKKFNLNPPVFVKNIILQNQNDTAYTQCLWYVYKGL